MGSSEGVACEPDKAISFTLNNMAMTEQVEEDSEPLPDLLHSDEKDGSVERIQLAP